MNVPARVDVVVVGAGISGLTAAYELNKQRTSALVLERSERVGGVIHTERVGEFVIDAGPDSLLVQKPAAVALCNEIGLGDRLFPTKAPRTAYVLRDGELHALPGASVLGFPTRVSPFLRSSLFSLRAQVRMGIDLVLPGRSSLSALRPGGRRRVAPELPAGGTHGDESIGSCVRRRFGPEAVTNIAEPL